MKITTIGDFYCNEVDIAADDGTKICTMNMVDNYTIELDFDNGFMIDLTEKNKIKIEKRKDDKLETPLKKLNELKTKNVHTEHCCFEHGCKYGEDDCPVATGLQKQSYPCEACDGVIATSLLKSKFVIIHYNGKNEEWETKTGYKHDVMYNTNTYDKLSYTNDNIFDVAKKFYKCGLNVMIKQGEEWDTLFIDDEYCFREIK